MAADWNDKFNTLSENKLEVEGNKEWRLAVEESKTKGTLQINARLFQNAKVEGGYAGPTKNGFIVEISCVDDIEKLQNSFNELFTEAKKLFE